MKDPDRPEVARFIKQHWGSDVVVACGQVYRPHEHEGLIERRDGEIVGLVTMRVCEDQMELLTLNATRTGQRIGSSLLLAAIDEARTRGLKRVWFITTNDNLRAIALYQRLGFRIVGVNVGGIDEARKLKPQIPEIGRDGIPLHDEIILELRLEPFSG
jgi:ribosomal protein S18 acetylase RimI-like enzyme